MKVKKTKIGRWTSIAILCMLCLPFKSVAHEDNLRLKQLANYIVQRLAYLKAENATKIAIGEEPNFILDINTQDLVQEGLVERNILDLERRSSDLQKLKQIWTLETLGLNQKLSNLIDHNGQPIKYYIIRSGIFNHIKINDLKEIRWENINSKPSVSLADQKEYKVLFDHIYERAKEKFHLEDQTLYHFVFSTFVVSQNQYKLYHFQAISEGKYGVELAELTNYKAELLNDTTVNKNNAHLTTFNSFVNKIVSLVAQPQKIETKNYIATYSNDKDGNQSVQIKLKGQGQGTQSDKAKLEDELSAMANEKLKELGGSNNRKTESVKEQMPEGGEFYVKAMTGAEWVTTIAELGNTVWETAALPRAYWHQDEGYNESNIHIPPLLSGTTDGVVEEITALPQLAKLGYQLSTNAELRKELWDAVKNISVESIKDAAIGFYEQKKENYTSHKGYVVQHTVSKDAVQVASIIAGTGFLKKGGDLTDGVKETGKKIAKEAREKATKEFLQAFDEAFIQKLKKIPNYDKLEAALLESWKKHHGSKFSLQYIYDNKLIDKIKTFELKIHSEGNFTADMVLKGGLGKGDKFIEFKSWKTGSFSLLNTPQYKNQLKAYMKSGDFEQIFDAKKLLADGIANPDIFVKQKIVDLIKKNAEEFKLFITEVEIKTLTVESSLIKKFNAK